MHSKTLVLSLVVASATAFGNSGHPPATCSDNYGTVKTQLSEFEGFGDCSAAVATTLGGDYTCDTDLGELSSDLTGSSVRDICCESCRTAEASGVYENGSGSGSACGFNLPNDDKPQVCVEVPPKVVTARRRLGTERRLVTATEQSMKFSCTDETEACLKYCVADHIFIKQVFLVEDEDDDRNSWAGGHIRVVIDEEPLEFSMDYTIGCDDTDPTADFLSQDFTDRQNFNCGVSEIGYDLYYRKLVGSECEQEKLINGDPYCYATMNNLLMGPSLQDVLGRVKSGEWCPGTYTRSFPKSYDNIVPHCVAEYKVNFVIPESEAPKDSKDSCSKAFFYTEGGDVTSL